MLIESVDSGTRVVSITDVVGVYGDRGAGVGLGVGPLSDRLLMVFGLNDGDVIKHRFYHVAWAAIPLLSF